MAASFFSPVRFVGVIGSDCPFDLAKVFAGRNVDLAGLEMRSLSKTFRWKGSYHDTASGVITENVELNVLTEPPPPVPAEFRDSKFVFLANTAPALQLELLEQIEPGAFVAADTMDCWIEGRLNNLKTLLRRIDCLIINENEAEMLASEHNLPTAGEKILSMGPATVVIKRGHAGSIAFSSDGGMFALPAFPVAVVKDPTGAGDGFAGGLMGYLAQRDKRDFESLKTAIAYGTVVASFIIAEFSLNGLTAVTKNDIDNRLETLRKLTKF
jgi:hypothetical protein